MKYDIEINIPWAVLGCNPEKLVCRVEESKSGIKKLKKYLQGLFGERNVKVWQDITEYKYEEIL